MWNTFIAIENDRLGFKTVLHCVIGIVLFIIANITAMVLSKALLNIISVNSIIIIINCCFSILFFLSLILLYIRKGLRKQLDFFRLLIN